MVSRLTKTRRAKFTSPRTFTSANGFVLTKPSRRAARKNCRAQRTVLATVAGECPPASQFVHPAASRGVKVAKSRSSPK
jgi:hypothetical protein